MKILMADTYPLPKEERSWLEGRGLEVFCCEDEAPCPYDPSQFEIVVCKLHFRYTPIERFTSLRYLQIFMAGFDHLPMDYIREHHIEFHNARDVYSIPIAEFGIGGVLALYKDFRPLDADQRDHEWRIRRQLRELTDKHVLIVGAGSIGTAFAQRFRAFGCVVTGLRRTPVPMTDYDAIEPMEALDRLLPQADIVVMCLPSNPETFHVLDRGRIRRMKQDALLVNIARGSLVDEQALTEALQEGRLGGAVLDVFEAEPLPTESPLWDMNNVIVRPHTSFGGEFNRRRQFEVLHRNLEHSSILQA